MFVHCLNNYLRSNILAFFLTALLLFPGYGVGQTDDPQGQLTIEDIEIDGNTKTKPYVIFRYLTIKKGNPLNISEILANQHILTQTDFFSSVDIYTRPGSEKTKVVVIIEVEERKWPLYRFEGGSSDLEGWYIIPVSFRLDNFFGRGNIFGWQWRIGNLASGSSFNYRKPDVFGSSGFLDIDLFFESQEFIHYIDEIDTSENVKSTGLRLKWGGTKGWFKHIYFTYNIIRYKPYYNDFLALHFPDDFKITVFSALGLGLHTDLRDNSEYPLSGIWGSVSGELVIKDIGKEIAFPKFLVAGRYYRRMFGRNVIAFHLKGGYTGGNAPFYERFYLGGAYSLRGYLNRRLAPIGWGTKLLLAQCEIRFPLSTRNFPNHRHTAILFYDMGGIWLPDQPPGIDDFYHSVGFGYRIKLPIVDIVRVDLSFPLNTVDNNHFIFHVSLGHTF